MDTRRCFTMETGYTSSDFSFYRKNPNSLEVTRSHIYDMQTRAGKEKWYLVDAYTHYWKSGHGSDRVLVLTNDNGVQSLKVMVSSYCLVSFVSCMIL